ncbi:hypothetical protein [Streptomyces sp. WM6386]|uniref:hypothetical protein n=1 Tax=Streptomyces sp. WM6386 TaxID=1415558 RepID=UPI000619703C|nr:hypothetical protein [Streptomyces sp. WM6386]
MTGVHEFTCGVAVPPYSAVQLVMHRQIVQEPGWGLFTGTAGEEIQIPFIVNVELFGSCVTQDV